MYLYRNFEWFIGSVLAFRILWRHDPKNTNRYCWPPPPKIPPGVVDPRQQKYRQVFLKIPPGIFDPRQQKYRQVFLKIPPGIFENTSRYFCPFRTGISKIQHSIFTKNTTRYFWKDRQVFLKISPGIFENSTRYFWKYRRVFLKIPPGILTPAVKNTARYFCVVLKILSLLLFVLCCFQFNVMICYMFNTFYVILYWV